MYGSNQLCVCVIVRKTNSYIKDIHKLNKKAKKKKFEVDDNEIIVTGRKKDGCINSDRRSKKNISPVVRRMS